MNPKIKVFLLKFLLPVVVFLILLAAFKPYVAIGLAVIYITYQLYSARASILALLGNMSYSKGDMQKSIEYFEKAYKTKKAKPKIIISYAYLLLKTGDVEASERILIKYLNTNPDFDSEMLAKSNLALVLWKKGNLDEAASMLEDVFGQFKTTTIYGSLGYFYILKGDLDKALEFNLEAYEYNGANTVILDNLGQTYYLRGELDNAEEIFEKLMAANPTYPEAYYNYGLVLADKGENDKALDIIEKALNYRISFLSTVTREQIDTKINELKSLSQK